MKTTIAMLVVCLGACGGGGSGGASANGADGWAVGPVAGRPAMPVPDPDCAGMDAGGLSCSVVTAGVANACNAVPAAGYLGCCCKGGLSSQAIEIIIPGGPADVCTMPHHIGDAPHPNCIEAPNVPAAANDVTKSPCGAGGSYDLGYQDGYVNGVDVGYGTGTGACCCY
jgi:hypothetical protein